MASRKILTLNYSLCFISKSQFDDFDNIQELDKNKDWTMQLAPTFLGEQEYQKGRVWLIFPDLKECELAKAEWAGQRYQEATFTTIQAVTNYLATGVNNNENGNNALLNTHFDTFP